MKKQNVMMNHSRLRFGITMLCLTGMLLFCLCLNICIGSVKISPYLLGEMLSDALRQLVSALFGFGERAGLMADVVSRSTQSRILFEIRLPRILLATILGGGLAVSGLLLQTFFRNPIAGPFVLGISSGAKMTVGFSLIVLTEYVSFIHSGTLIFAAFAGALVVTGVILLCSGHAKNMSTLLVIGIMIGYICSAVTDLMVTFANEHDILNLTNWSMGTFSGSDWKHVTTATAVCLPSVLAAWLLSKPMEAYSLGEGIAKSMGIRIRLFRIALLLLSSLLSACVTALAGPVSFVGIAVPHIARSLLKSAKPFYVIPVTFLCGAIFCVLCDLIARTAFAPTELAIGTVTSVFGAPIVISIMLKRRRG